MTNAETYSQTFARHAEARRELGKSNKGAIFDVLAAFDITEVLVEFDGNGDSGQIEMLTVVQNGEPVPMPEATVQLRQASFGGTEIATPNAPSRKALRCSATTSSKTSMARIMSAFYAAIKSLIRRVPETRLFVMQASIKPFSVDKDHDQSEQKARYSSPDFRPGV